MMQLKNKHRGVSEVITTLLLLAITMVGAVFVASIVQSSMITTTDQTGGSSEFIANSVRLVAYDSRDSSDLSGITDLHNHFSQFLCTVSCQSEPDKVPSGPSGGAPTGGTDFIVLQIRNTNINSIYIHTLFVNGIQHVWDADTSGVLLNAEIDDPPPSDGAYPYAGKFSIIDSAGDIGLIQRTSNEVFPGEEVRIVIKLSEKIPNDIEMWRPVQIHLNYGGTQPTEYIILSGDAR